MPAWVYMHWGGELIRDGVSNDRGFCHHSSLPNCAKYGTNTEPEVKLTQLLHFQLSVQRPGRSNPSSRNSMEPLYYSASSNFTSCFWHWWVWFGTCMEIPSVCMHLFISCTSACVCMFVCLWLRSWLCVFMFRSHSKILTFFPFALI